MAYRAEQLFSAQAELGGIDAIGLQSMVDQPLALGLVADMEIGGDHQMSRRVSRRRSIRLRLCIGMSGNGRLFPFLAGLASIPVGEGRWGGACHAVGKIAYGHYRFGPIMQRSESSSGLPAFRPLRK
ncbi:hypothetical protein GCM10027514_15670 [Azotobacter armeniacus]